MTTVQLQKTRAADTFTKTAIDQKQSLDVVQTMLHGGLSSISYLRSFFPEKAFDECLYKMSERIQPYEDYAMGKTAPATRQTSAPKTIMRVLRRERSKRVDLFLDWLEKGAFAALKDGKLQALQVYVHADPTDREKVIETYTFTIKYTPNEENGKKLAGVQMDSQGSQAVSVGATNSALQCLLRQTMNICEQLPDLPEKRFVSMSLLYTDPMDESNQPNGFIRSTMSDLFFAEAEGWEKNTEVLEQLQAGYHNAVLKVVHLQPKGQRLHPGLTGFPPISFPEQLRYPTPSSVYDDADFKQIVNNSSESSEREGAILDSIRMTPSTIVENEVDDQPTVAIQQLEDTEQTLITPGPTSDANTQSSNIPEMTRAFHNMMQDENLTQGDTQTQMTMRLPDHPSTYNEGTESDTCSMVSPSKVSELATPAKRNEPVLSQAVANQLEKSKPELHQAASKVAKEKGFKKKRSDFVLCQCGYDKDDGDMVNCVYCGTWQHLHCYGYTGEDDQRLPAGHVCYQCLLAGGDERTLNLLRDLAQKRRGMHVALENGLKTKRDFATDIGLPMVASGRVYDYLRTQGYVVGAPGSHRAGYHTSGKPLFVPVKEGPKHEQMLKDLFDPMLHISHHYELPASRDAIVSSLPKSLSNKMPPPATPASRLMNSMEKTPGSALLDLRQSQTPFETPVRPRSRQVQSLKRPRDEGEVDQTFAKRIRHTNSVQSAYLLDAGGLSSSPAAAS